MEVAMACRFSIFIVPPVIVVGVFLAGCGPAAKSGKSEVGKAEEHHDHDHAHEGPHGGHLVELGNEDYHAEWVHEESGKITVYILDGAAKKEVPISAESIKISVSVGTAHETQVYELPAMDRTTGDKPTAFKFETVSKELLGALETPKSTSPVVQVDIHGKAYTGKIEEHDEHGHHH
jgi:hypothetical protein